MNVSFSPLLHDIRRAQLCFQVSKVFRPPCFRDTRCSNMEIQSIGGMMLTAAEWTRRGKQKRTRWRSLGTFETTKCSRGYRGAVTKIKLFSRSSNFIQPGFKHSVPSYRVSQEERTKLREGVPYVKLYRYNPKHLYPKLNGYGDNGQRSLKL